MNRKGRAKLNNQLAREKRERKACPRENEVFTEPTCDTCGSDLVPARVVGLILEAVEKEKLH